MIRRLWHGWTTPENADAYQHLLAERIFPGIRARAVPGLVGLEAWRHDGPDEVEFVTLMTFRDRAGVAAFTGGDPHQSVVPAEAREVLSRFDEHSQHYEQVIENSVGA